MSIKNRYIYVGSLFESELVQTLLFEAGAGWMHSGKSSVSVTDSYIVINSRLEMFARENKPLHSFYKELTLLELAAGETFMETETLYICEVSDNHISFEGTEVALTPDELSEVLRVIESLSHRDFEITTSDGDERIFPLANLTINFK